MLRDDSILNEPQEAVRIAAPERIVADSWCSGSVPVRKIVRRKEEFVATTKPESRTNSVRSGQSGHSKMTKGSLRSKLKRTAMDIDSKKALQNIPDEDAADSKPKIIRLGPKKGEDAATTKKTRRARGADSAKESEPKKVGLLPINLGQGTSQRTKPSMSIGLKTGRLSMRSSNAYKFHPNKPFTFDHTGRKMAVTHLKPERIPDNRVTPIVSFQNADDAKPTGPSSPKQGRKMGVARKNRKKSAAKPKSTAQPVVHRITTAVSVQPRVESICKPAKGVTLKTESGVTLKGPLPDKKSIANLSRSEYNQYIAALRTAPKTQVFETRRKKSTENLAQRDSECVVEQSPSAERLPDPVIAAPPIGARTNSSPKSLRYRVRNHSPKSLKHKRARMTPHSDRVISEHNKHSMLPPIHTKDPSTRPNDRYQREFVEEIGTETIEKSKLGMSMFADTEK